jgi:hypothetical protein
MSDGLAMGGYCPRGILNCKGQDCVSLSQDMEFGDVEFAGPRRKREIESLGEHARTIRTVHAERSTLTCPQCPGRAKYARG